MTPQDHAACLAYDAWVDADQRARINADAVDAVARHQAWSRLDGLAYGDATAWQRYAEDDSAALALGAVILRPRPTV